ncbi:MAG: hypothetical protein DI586_10520 [Micavibrio aeruginosavorus]|uniref:Lipoprotein n=1 Tax=Micavibrio aeruginosavorus TaxID=349221 RepID=A0A2W5H7I9_9BACT|nr:MAG: hypothetical protein DI586_10520 [Micavibrio aeruginosavorus]
MSEDSKTDQPNGTQKPWYAGSIFGLDGIGLTACFGAIVYMSGCTVSKVQHSFHEDRVAEQNNAHSNRLKEIAAQKGNFSKCEGTDDIGTKVVLQDCKPAL